MRYFVCSWTLNCSYYFIVPHYSNGIIKRRKVKLSDVFPASVQVSRMQPYQNRFITSAIRILHPFDVVQ